MLKGITLTLMIGAVRAEAVPQPVIDALTGVQVTSASGQPSGFQLTFTLGKRSPVSQLFEAGYFSPPRRVIIVVTLEGSAEVLMDGVITKHDFTVSNEPGQAKLTVTGEDLTRMMDLIDLTGLPYPAMPAEVRVLIALAKYGIYLVKPLIMPSVLIDLPLPTNDIPQQFGTDLEYITALAARVGYVFYIEPGPKAGMSTAYWGPEIKTGIPQAALIANSDALNNTETLSFSFDGFKKTLYVILIYNDFTKLPIPIPIPDVNPLSPPLGLQPPFPMRISPLRGLARYNPIQAALIGLAKAAKAADVITGSGSLDVLRYGRVLKARQLVEVRGAGQSYDGLHFVKSVTHNIKPGEYKQNFSLSRNAFRPFSAS
jgi:hypothetical protein